MSTTVDWSWKLREAIDRIRNRYDHIGRKTGAPFLAIVYPPEAEAAVLREWRTLIASLGEGFSVCTIDVLDLTMKELTELGAENLVASFCDPMPGSDPEADLGHLWVRAVGAEIKQIGRASCRERV